MPRATGRATSLSRYEETWEAINRMIRRGGSWSGLERNCFFARSDDGGFLNVSGASGLDVLQDGRAVCVFDYDRDGDPDLVLKSRDAPQLRLWRNETNAAERWLSIRLEGAGAGRSNRSAIGARVEARSAGRVQVQEVRAGSGFLSQNSKTLRFGGGDARAFALTVRWPSGETQRFDDVSTGRAYILREGKALSEDRRVELPGARGDAALVGGAAEDASRGEGADEVDSGRAARAARAESETVLVEPLAVPPVELRRADGGPFRFDSLRGEWTVLTLWSETCAACLAEFAEWRAARDVDSAVRWVALSRWPEDGENSLAIAARRAERAQSYGAEPLFVSERSLLIFAILFEEVARWPRDLALPSSVLIDPNGNLVRLYRGRVPWPVLAAAVAEEQRPGWDRIAGALPFPGRYFATSLRRSYFQLGVQLVEAGLDEARWAFGLALDRRPGDVDTLYNLAVILQESGEDARALELYDEIVRLRRDFVDAWVNRGVLLAESEQFEAALASFSEAIARRPDHAEARVNAGNVYLRLGRVEDALAAYLKAVELEPELGGLRKNLGSLYRRLGDLPRALEAYRAAVDLDPRDGDGWSVLGAVHAQMGDLERAVVALERAVEVDPRSAGARNNLALVYQGLGRTRDAIRELERAVELAPSLPAASVNLARAYAREGRVAPARRVLEALLERVPDHPAARRLLEGLPR